MNWRIETDCVTETGRWAALLACALELCAPGLGYQEGQGAFVASDGLLAVELEQTDASGRWTRPSTVKGASGERAVLWQGVDYSTDPGHGAFSIDFLIDTPGNYQLRVRNQHDQASNNTIWMRLDGGPWQTLRSVVTGRWTWSTEQNQAPASLDLVAGPHVLEFAGGSPSLLLDRVHVYLPAHVDGERVGLPLSCREHPNSAPSARFSVSPPALPGPDGGSTVVTLDASASFDPDANQTLSYTWRPLDGVFVNGTTAKSRIAQVRFQHTGRALPIALEVIDDDAIEPMRRSQHQVLGVSDPQVQTLGAATVGQPLELWFQGPFLDELSVSPNPFLDYRLDVTFVGPTGQTARVPGFYSGDGLGGSAGNIWKVKFAPDTAGTWTWSASFRTGTEVAVAANPLAGLSTGFDGAAGSVDIRPLDPVADGFSAKGRLSYVGEHYLRFANGEYFLKAGTDSPENLFGYVGFDDVKDAGGLGILHRYGAHAKHWRRGDPLFTSADTKVSSKGIIGTLNYLSERDVNSVYFLPMNLGGDGQETYPFVDFQPTSFSRTHYDVSRLRQWALVADHAQSVGIQLHIVLAETESANENWLDQGQLGVERKLFFRELVSRFAHVSAIKWNLCEENDFSIQQLIEFGTWLADLDVYGHPIGVHTSLNDFSDYSPLLGLAPFTSTSIQYSPQKGGGFAETWRAQSAAAQRPWVIDLDENSPASSGLNDDNADDLRKDVLYDVYFSGGQLEWYAGYHNLPLGGDLKLEDFRTRSQMWRYMSIARGFMQDHVAFWNMAPADNLLQGESSDRGGGEVLAETGVAYAVYLPNASPSGFIDLSAETGELIGRWFDPRTGTFEGQPQSHLGGEASPLGTPPRMPNEDWVYLIQPGS